MKEGDVTVDKQGCCCPVYFFAKGFCHGGLMTVVAAVNSISQGGWHRCHLHLVATVNCLVLSCRATMPNYRCGHPASDPSHPIRCCFWPLSPSLSSRHLREVQQGGVWSKPGLPGHGQPLPRWLLHLRSLQWVPPAWRTAGAAGAGPWGKLFGLNVFLV